MTAVWQMTVAKGDFVEAVGIARTKATLRGKGGIAVESEITLVASDEGLSVRSSYAAMDIDGVGSWPSPVMVHGATVRKLAPKLSGQTINLRYSDSQLFLNGTSLPARDV